MSEEIKNMRRKVGCDENIDCWYCPYAMNEGCLLDLYNKEKENIDRLQKELDRKDKVIDLMAEHIFKNSNNLAEYFCNGIPENICEARGNTEEGCRYCIKLYFNKKVEE